MRLEMVRMRPGRHHESLRLILSLLKYCTCEAQPFVAVPGGSSDRTYGDIMAAEGHGPRLILYYLSVYCS